MNLGLLIPIIAVSIPIVVVPVALFFKHANLQRELEHAERMKALEMGRTLPQDEPWWSPPRIAVAIGAVVPIASLGIAFVTTEAGGPRDEVWIFSSLVALAGVICGSTLSVKHFNHKAAIELAALQANPSSASGKPAFDPDAYDVAGSRG